MFGKDFRMIRKLVRSKTITEVVEFYYAWKMTPSYRAWKHMWREVVAPAEQ